MKRITANKKAKELFGAPEFFVKKDRIVDDQNCLIMLHQQMVDLYKDQIKTLESYGPNNISAMLTAAGLKILVKNAEDFTSAMIERRELYKQELSDEE